MPLSNTLILIVAAVAAVAVIALIALAIRKNRRSRHLRDRFGPEYARLAEAAGGERAAEREMELREKRAAKFHIVDLSEDNRRRFSDRWQTVQAEFVEDPKQSLADADDLLGEVMSARGYPVLDFEQKAADLSVDHPVVVQHYHAAHGIALRHRDGATTTEDLRQAMIHYKALFNELAGVAVVPAPAPSQAHAAE